MQGRRYRYKEMEREWRKGKRWKIRNKKGGERKNNLIRKKTAKKQYCN